MWLVVINYSVNAAQFIQAKTFVWDDFADLRIFWLNPKTGFGYI